LLLADYHQFYVMDAQSAGPDPEAITTQSLLHRVHCGTDHVAVFTLRNATVPVQVTVLPEAPDLDEEAWDHCVDGAITLPSGRLLMLGCTEAPDDAASLDLAPGGYRLRVSMSGLASGSDDAVAPGGAALRPTILRFGRGRHGRRWSARCFSIPWRGRAGGDPRGLRRLSRPVMQRAAPFGRPRRGGRGAQSSTPGRPGSVFAGRGRVTPQRHDGARPAPSDLRRHQVTTRDRLCPPWGVRSVSRTSALWWCHDRPEAGAIAAVRRISASPAGEARVCHICMWSSAGLRLRSVKYRFEISQAGLPHEGDSVSQA